MPLFTTNDVNLALRRTSTTQQGDEAAGPANGRRLFDAESMRQPYGGAAPVEWRPTALTSDLWMLEGKYLQLHGGIQNASWQVGIRAGEEEIKSGHARFATPRRTHGNGSTFLSEPVVNFTFQSGNLLPIPKVGPDVGIPYGLTDFYYFLELLNQPPIIPRLPQLDPEGAREGGHNYVWVYYQSLIFPEIVLRGYMQSDGTAWSDEAESPTEFTWTASMVVHESTPELFHADELVGKYEEVLRGGVRQF